jgi:hypothetical protein
MENEILKAGAPLTPVKTSVEPEVCTEYGDGTLMMPKSGDMRGMTKTGEVKNPKFHTNESEKLPSDISFRNGGRD